MTGPATRPALGQVVRARRIALEMSQEELAARVTDLGSPISQADISRIELGKVALPRRRRLEHLARALGLTPGELLAASGWAGAAERIDVLTSTVAPPPAPQPPPTPVASEPHVTWQGPAWPSHEPIDAQAAIAAVQRLRSAIAQAQEPIADAARLLQDCRATSLRWKRQPRVGDPPRTRERWHG